MHLSEKPVNYSGSEEFIHDINDLSLEAAKELVIKLYRDNRHYKHLTAKAAVTIDQYKHLASVFDGYITDKKNQVKNLSDKGYNLHKMVVNVLQASRHLAFWVCLLSEAASHVVYENNSVIQKMYATAKDVCNSICDSTSKIEANNFVLQNETNGIRVENLERTGEENSKNSGEENRKGFYSRQSELIDRENENTNKLPKKDAKLHYKSGQSNLCDENSLQDGAKSDEPRGASSQQSSSGNETIRGGENSEITEKRKEKPFKISYLKSKSLFKKDLLRGKKTNPNISVTYEEKSPSTSLYHPARSESMNEEDQSSSVDENDSDKDANSFPKAGTSPAKGLGRYKRKHSPHTHESNLREKEKSKSRIYTSQSSIPVSKKPRRYRRNHSDTSQSDAHIMSIDESKHKRPYKSRKQNFSDTHESELIEKPDSFITSETEAEDAISIVKPKRGRRGRKKKLNVMQEEEKNKLNPGKCESVSLENVPSTSSSRDQLCVFLTDVVKDPAAQRYPDVIQLLKKRSSESESVAKEQNEMEKTCSNERNEMDALQEWNVLDAVSDEEDKELDNMEGNEELSNNNDSQQTSDSDGEQEQMVTDDDKQLEIDDSERELDDGSSTKHDESCSKHDDKNYSLSEDETKEYMKGPRTPPGLGLDDFSDTQDENDADADSDGSNEEEDKWSTKSQAMVLNYGKAGHRSPPPSALNPLRRGPKTPPGSGPESEVMEEESSSEYPSD